MNHIQTLNKVLDKQDLSSIEIKTFLDGIVSGEVNGSQIAAFMAGLRVKGETSEEIAGLIEGMRKHMIVLPGIKNAVDTCGTGGDGTGTFNISTTVAFVVAGAGLTVTKHGNRAASSNCGSADVLETLGVHVMLKPAQAKAVVDKVGMVFLFAPLYHPAMKHIAPIRKELGIRTVFNYLGPFINPAGVKRQLVGVPSQVLAKQLAQVARKLDYEHLIIASCENGMDEIDISQPTKIYEVKGNNVTSKTIDPSKFGFKKAAPKALYGGNAHDNAKIIMEIMHGKKGAQRDIVVFNSAFVLYTAGRVKSIAKGIIMAEEAIDSGKAKNSLENLIKETKKYA
jgi:anthranilate phosphoribosyltransferase